MRRYKSQITRRSELGFHAVLGDGQREVRLEWGTQAKRLVEDVLSLEFSLGRKAS